MKGKACRLSASFPPEYPSLQSGSVGQTILAAFQSIYETVPGVDARGPAAYTSIVGGKLCR